MTKDLLEQIRLLRNYNFRKMRAMENYLKMLTDFAREDLKRIDKLEENIIKSAQKTSIASGGKDA